MLKRVLNILENMCGNLLRPIVYRILGGVEKSLVLSEIFWEVA